MIFEFSWPPKELNPNKRLHWAVRDKFRNKYRSACYWQVRACQKVFHDHTSKIPITVIFYPPDNRRRDADNCISSFKAGQDGMAEALGIDDRYFSPTYRFGDPIKGGKVAVKLDLVG